MGSASGAATSVERPELIICADLFHTLGAATYAFRSFVAIAARAASELDAVVTVQMPPPSNPPFGFGADFASVFTEQSLRAVADALKFTWQPWDWRACSFGVTDARIADRLLVHRGVSLNRSNLSALIEREALLPSIRKQRADQVVNDTLAEYLQGIWSYLRGELRVPSRQHRRRFHQMQRFMCMLIQLLNRCKLSI